MIIIGSEALKFWYPDFPREPKDTDYAIGSNIASQYKSNAKEEYLVNDCLIEYVENFIPGLILRPDLLYTLKMSHMFWDIKWDKHMFDIQFMRKKGCVLVKDLFYKLYDYWNSINVTNKRSDLEMSAEDFFDNAIDTGYEHDDLHTLLNHIPTYAKVLKDGAEVEVSEEKFDNLSFEDKCNLVYEEVELMSWERWPNKPYYRAYSKMLKKFIISHAPLWEAIFIIENYVTLHKPRRDHFKIINDGLRNIKQSSKGLKIRSGGPLEVS